MHVVVIIGVRRQPIRETAVEPQDRVRAERYQEIDVGQPRRAQSVDEGRLPDALDRVLEGVAEKKAREQENRRHRFAGVEVDAEPSQQSLPAVSVAPSVSRSVMFSTHSGRQGGYQSLPGLASLADDAAEAAGCVREARVAPLRVR